MAEGILLLLIGDENKKRKEYQNLKKIYESEIIFGIRTDTYDALGMIVGVHSQKLPEKKDVEDQFGKMIGKRHQQYPPYSSKPVNGKPLYWWARQGKLSEIEIPEKEIEIYSVKILSFSTISSEYLLEDVLRRIVLVSGNFRQDEISQKWKETLIGNAQFLAIRIEIACSSGTYIRDIANQLGGDLGVGAFANTITRTRIGSFTKKDCVPYIEAF
jgi:tRNA pseudouridine55 synthase